MAERLALPTSDQGVAGSNPVGGEILPLPKRRFIAQSLSCSPFHRLEMTEILLKGRKTITYPSIFFSFPCYLHRFVFDWLKSHTPFPWPLSKLINIFLKFQCVLCIPNFSVTKTAIRKESYFRINVCRDIINVQRKQQGTKDSALWGTRKTRSPVRFCFVYNNSLF